MNSYPKFALIAAGSLLIAALIGLAVRAPELLSVELFTSVGFWIPVLALFLAMILGFWVGQRSKFT